MNDQSKQLVSDLRRWAHAPEALPASDMMDKAATEIERLLVAIAAYAASSKAAAKEIARLRLTDEAWGINPAGPAPAADGTDWPTGGAGPAPGGCTPQLDCGADRKSVASQRCCSTGGQPSESAPITGAITRAAYDGDIVSRLRNWRGLHLSHSGELFEDAASEIERLRPTDAEREAVELAIDAANGMGQAEPWTMRALRGLLERIK